MQISKLSLIGVVLAAMALPVTATSAYFSRINEIASKPHVVLECDIGSDAMGSAIQNRSPLTFQLCLDWQLKKNSLLGKKPYGAQYYSMIQIWSDGKGTPIPWDGWTDSAGQPMWRP